MKVLIEGESYQLKTLQHLFHGDRYYSPQGTFGVIQGVGYYHSYITNEVVYMLPKVFMQDVDKTIFGYTPLKLLELSESLSGIDIANYKWVQQISILFYNSLIEFKKRKTVGVRLSKSKSFELSSNLGDNEYSYLDIVLSFVNFYKKNSDFLLYTSRNIRSKSVEKIKWERTIRKNLPTYMQAGTPIYAEYFSKKKYIDVEDTLLIYYFSILEYFNANHQLGIKIGVPYKLIQGQAFERLKRTGSTRLRKIKSRYFSDRLKRIYRLCEIFFGSQDKAKVRHNQYDYLFISGYNTVFEDMIDKLFSDKYMSNESGTISIADLKANPDGKIIDHLYTDRSLIDTSNIFFIGDSKYYKVDREAGKLSEYKQYTYAKNIIQFNIDLMNSSRSISGMRYRDALTEGYSITPNFFIYGYIEQVDNFSDPCLICVGEPATSWQYEGRLFDRDTLFVHKYRINYLFVLKAYTAITPRKISSFRTSARGAFRGDIIEYFNDVSRCMYAFYKSKKVPAKLPSYIRDHFRLLLGKAYLNENGELLIAVHREDDSLDSLLNDFVPYQLV
jgi:hypothetical protein